MEFAPNNSPTLLVIASYPPKGEKHSKAIVGGAMYAKNTLEATRKAALIEGINPQVVVLAEAFQGKVETYDEEGITVKRFWKRNSLLTFLQLTREILKYKSARTIVIEFELVMFGGNLSLLDLPLFLLLLRLLKKRVVFVFHQVLSDVSEMSGHLNLPEKSLKTKAFNLLYKVLYTSLLSFSSEAVVFEEVLKRRLHRLNRRKKVTVIPFGTESFSDKVSKTDARKKLGLPEDAFILFSFGFIAWYKGTDWIVTQVSHMEEKPLLIIGGGPNPNHLGKAFYKTYVDSVEQKSKENGILVTGFIPEEKMPLYFQASDLVILPYRTLMSSSGPLSLAFSFEKPALLSKPMESMFQTYDIKEVLNELKMKEDDLMFPMDDTFPERLKDLMQNKEELKKLTDFSKRIGEKRAWDDIGKLYADVFLKQ